MSKATIIPMDSTELQGPTLRAFLEAARDLVAETEPQTRRWYALSREGDDRGVAIFDTFDDQAGREAHFGGQVAGALKQKAPELVKGGWDAILGAVVHYERLAGLERKDASAPTKATYITLRAAAGRADELADFLRLGRDRVEQTEPNTLTWYALRSETDANAFAIFDLFPHEGGRGDHFGGQVAAALQAQAADLVEGGWENGVLANVRHYDVRAAL